MEKNKVLYIRNITDIDDKIIEASKNKNNSINRSNKKNYKKKFHQ